MYRALIRSFVENKKMVTTSSKAKVIIPMIEKLITKAKRGTVSDRRLVYGFMSNDRIIADKIFALSKVIVPKNGGFLTYVNLPARKGDNAPMTRVELTEKVPVNETKVKTNEKDKSHKAGDEPGSVKKKPSVSSAIKKLSFRKTASK